MAQYDHLSRKELIALLIKKEAERKFGLVWERDEIEHDKALNDDYVFMEFDTDLSEGESPYENLIIEGDNFDALRFLNLTHKGKIKCIYIDPPYNTGNKEWVYNDRFVEKDHAFRHSIWLEFMYRRLTLAKDLLREDGVIFISIDDNEMHHLRMLCDEVFPGMFVGVFPWKRRTGANDEKTWFLSVDHEYVLCYANAGFYFTGATKDQRGYTNPDNDPRGPWTRGDLTTNKDRLQRPNTYYPIQNPENGVWYPCDPMAVWRFGSTKHGADEDSLRSDSIETIIEKKKVIFPKNDRVAFYNTKQELIEAIRNGTAPSVLSEDMPDLDFFVGKPIGYGRPGYKRHLSEVKSDYKPFSTWIKPSSEDEGAYADEDKQYLECGLTTEGTRELKRVFGGRKKPFQHPKPPSLISALIEQATNPNNGDIVLDFFAGSGTTGDVVLRLNTKDGGNRKFILVSSTEATAKEPDKNICRDVTAQRVRNVIRGYSYMTSGKKPKRIEVPGSGSSFAYLRARRIEQEEVLVSLRHDQVWIALQLIHFETISEYTAEKEYMILDDKHIRIAYIRAITEEVLDNLQKLLDSDTMTTVVYSWQPGVVSQYLQSEHLTVDKIPDYLVARLGGVA